MMPECCGRKCETPYCPLCGAKVGEPSPGIELVKYLTRCVQAAKPNQADKWQARLEWAKTKLDAELSPASTAAQ